MTTDILENLSIVHNGIHAFYAIDTDTMHELSITLEPTDPDEVHVLIDNITDDDELEGAIMDALTFIRNN